jgi:hypothetical protein
MTSKFNFVVHCELVTHPFRKKNINFFFKPGHIVAEIYLRDHSNITDVSIGLGGWIQKLAIFDYKQYIEGGWVRKSPKHAYVMFEWSLMVYTQELYFETTRGLYSSTRKNVKFEYCYLQFQIKSVN